MDGRLAAFPLRGAPMSTVLGIAVRRVRVGRKLTQTQLGALMGLHYATINRWENGATEPTDEQLKKLAAVLRLDPVRMVADALNAEIAERPAN
jgi:transcriptional regulator with XRE-family HTH domain